MTNYTLPERSTGFHSWSWLRTFAPIATLIVLAPVLAELLPGIVHITNLWLLLPEMAVYGTVAVAIRYITLERHRGWGTLLLLGIAFGIALECIILQTSLTPQFFPAGVNSFGWASGVQWIYLIALVGFESVYAIVLPIKLTELIFPDRRHDPWLDKRGFIITIIVFLVSSLGVWLLWNRVGLQRYGPSTYQVPVLYVGLALVIVAALVIGTLYLRPGVGRVGSAGHRAWSPWLVGPIAFIFGLFWFIPIAFPYLEPAQFDGLSPFIPIGFALVWSGLTLLFVRHQTTGQGWRDGHRLALIFGAILASMVGGVLLVVTAEPIDKLGKLAFDLIAIIALAWFAWRMRQRDGSGIRGGSDPR